MRREGTREETGYKERRKDRPEGRTSEILLSGGR